METQWTTAPNLMSVPCSGGGVNDGLGVLADFEGFRFGLESEFRGCGWRSPGLKPLSLRDFFAGLKPCAYPKDGSRAKAKAKGIGKSKSKSKMRGFFASLRMTSKRVRMTNKRVSNDKQKSQNDKHKRRQQQSHNDDGGRCSNLRGMKIAIVTGAAQGIGRRTAEVLAGAGYGLLLMDMQPCTATLAAVREAGAEAEEVAGDLTDEVVVERGVKAARSWWGQVDVLVNNAGISLIAPAETVDAKTFRRVLEVNLVAPFLLAKGFGAMMLERRSGSIVNVASIAGLVGVADRAAYNASKHGLVGLTRALAAAWCGRGGRANAVCPWWV